MSGINGHKFGTTSQQRAAGAHWHLVPLLLPVPHQVNPLPTMVALCPPPLKEWLRRKMQSRKQQVMIWKMGVMMGDGAAKDPTTLAYKGGWEPQ